MNNAVFAVPGLIVTLSLISLFCFRMAAWHRHESAFWHEMALLRALDMCPDDAPALLAWAQTHDPSVIERLRGWRAPHERRRAALSKAAS